jgi:hypothetical protein
MPFTAKDRTKRTGEYFQRCHALCTEISFFQKKRKLTQHLIHEQSNLPEVDGVFV